MSKSSDLLVEMKRWAGIIDRDDERVTPSQRLVEQRLGSGARFTDLANKIKEVRAKRASKSGH